MTYKAFENAMVTVMATGGSTNAVMHYIAMARAAGIPLSLDDWQRVSDKVRYVLWHSASPGREVARSPILYFTLQRAYL
jgi:dihydroxyacid dehydratase/phosphogluconate dehydratase